ncbi:gamma-glutamyltransferase family protein [Nocardioides marinquilinus]|uniref:Gamma-glutamyltransferase family protein n=1 Tax=Nocardioides marinquilinus TaxID=1210400 RepID=A0ABP9PUE6_9ACTN
MNGAVATVDHRATAAAEAVLREGGSAADAAVCANAVLAVTGQHLCGAGGDLVALVRTPTGDVEALLAVGRFGSNSEAARLRAEGHRRVPHQGDPRAVTVPGCVDGWTALHARHGRLPLARLLEPAVALATDGFEVTPLLAAALPSVAHVAGGEELVGDLPVAAGDRRRRPALAAALAAIGRDGRDAWYGGAFGRGLQALAPGLFSDADLARDQAGWTTPARLRVGDAVLLSTPPPTAGHLVLAGAHVAHAVGALGGGDPHLLVEAARAVGGDRLEVLHEDADPAALLDPGRLAAQAATVDPHRRAPGHWPAGSGGTTYLCVADGDGLVVSLSQSNASGFGSGLAVREVGVFLHNRGIGASLDPDSPALLRPGGRPTTTLVPALRLAGGHDAGTVTALGTMGGDAQPQILLQLLDALATGATPAEALARPRWALEGRDGTGFDTWQPGPDGRVEPAVLLEDAAPEAWARDLRALGHDVHARERGIGHAQLLVRHGDGSEARLVAAADPRAGTGDARAW